MGGREDDPFKLTISRQENGVCTILNRCRTSKSKEIVGRHHREGKASVWLRIEAMGYWCPK
jgi:hypothetical protein